MVRCRVVSQIGEKQEVEKFNEWLGTLPHMHKIVVAGNHDIAFDTDHYESLWRRFHKMKVVNYRCAFRYFTIAWSRSMDTRLAAMLFFLKYRQGCGVLE